MAQQHEYLVIDLAGLVDLARQSWLNSLGLEGWELVSVSGPFAYLKRPIYLGFVLDEEGCWVEEEVERPEPPPPAPPAKRESMTLRKMIKARIRWLERGKP